MKNVDNRRIALSLTGRKPLDVDKGFSRKRRAPASPGDIARLSLLSKDPAAFFTDGIRRIARPRARMKGMRRKF